MLAKFLISHVLYISFHSFRCLWWVAVSYAHTVWKEVFQLPSFTIPCVCFLFCHFSIILGFFSVGQARLLKLPLFLQIPIFHYFHFFLLAWTNRVGFGMGKSGYHHDMQTTQPFVWMSCPCEMPLATKKLCVRSSEEFAHTGVLPHEFQCLSSGPAHHIIVLKCF